MSLLAPKVALFAAMRQNDRHYDRSLVLVRAGEVQVQSCSQNSGVYKSAHQALILHNLTHLLTFATEKDHPLLALPNLSKVESKPDF